MFVFLTVDIAHLQPCSKLSTGFQKVDIIRADVILSEFDDRGAKALISVMICRMLTNVSIEFEYLDEPMNTCVGGLSKQNLHFRRTLLQDTVNDLSLSDF